MDKINKTEIKYKFGKIIIDDVKFAEIIMILEKGLNITKYQNALSC